MTDSVTLRATREMFDEIWTHLLSDESTEQAAFAYATVGRDDGEYHFDLVTWDPVPPAGFEVQSAYYMELTDEARAGSIKRAHDLGLALVEFHSHTGPWPAAFSPSDFSGFAEFVPHVWWRLKGRPYAAVVVVASGFDGLAWTRGPDKPDQISALTVDGERHPATGLSNSGQEHTW